MSFSADPLSVFGLRPVTLADRPAMEPFFRSLRSPLSDYTFSQLFTWRNSLRIAWNVIDAHLCVFANGSGDLTLLLPPIGDTNSDRALLRCAEIMDAYNSAHACRDKSRVEYVSEELMARFDTARLSVAPQGTDYLYDVTRMIDLAGGDLASKRQAKNRFARNYKHRAEPYDHAKHFMPCLELLDQWKERQDGAHAGDDTSSFIKRTKESLATQLTLEHAGDLGLKGMVVYVTDEQGVDRVKGFTFGEALGLDQSSIVVEKTDLECKGLAQFIFSEFCRTAWADRPLVNAGDDWGLETLAWTKSSYRPVQLLKKFAMTPPVTLAVAMPSPAPAPSLKMGDVVLVDDQSLADGVPFAEEWAGETAVEAPQAAPAVASSSSSSSSSEITIRRARREDLDAICAIEQGCFSTYNLSRRQLQYLQQRDTAVFLVAERDGQVVGEGIALLRHHKQSLSGRAYSLAVDPKHRGQRIGERLMRAMLDQLRDRNVRRVYLEVEKTNASAVHLYERLGFRSIGALPDYYGPGRDGLHMMCEVAVPAPTIPKLAA
jgi:ribosomal protein S18 acetylase RimI-like enzyme